MIKEAVELLLLSYRENAAKDAPGNAIWEKLKLSRSHLGACHGDEEKQVFEELCVDEVIEIYK